MSFNLNQKEQIIKILDEMVQVLREIRELLNIPATREADKPRNHDEETRL